MRAFDIAHAVTMALVAIVPSLIVIGAGDIVAVLPGMLAGAVAATIAGLICRWWPGLAASWWRLFLAAWLFNPVVPLCLLYILSQYDCLVGQQRGWSCMGLALAVMAMPLTLIAPAVAVIVHVIARKAGPPAVGQDPRPPPPS
ncbi:MAG: hypothetical protein FJX20_04400 [Alphaproteobacteria bacterium]|nr:hypothetical protein [Alphaproteobacteria bacterium]